MIRKDFTYVGFYKKENVRETRANVFREPTTRESELKGRTGESFLGLLREQSRLTLPRSEFLAKC